MEQAAEPAGCLEVGLLDWADFLSLEDAWPALLQRTGHDAPFYRHELLRAWCRHFGAHRPLRVVTARDEVGLRAALCLVEARERLYGVPVLKLRGAANEHSGRFDLLADPLDRQAIAAVWAHLRDALRWDVVELPDVPVHGAGGDGAARALLAHAQEDGFPTGTWESMQTPYVPLDSPFEALLAARSPKLRQNLRRRRRRLAEQGPVAIEWVSGGPELGPKLEEGLALEASGWKGEQGTAIANDPATRGFYVELAREAAARGYLSLCFLRCGGTAVAFHFGMVHRGRYYLPKLGIDERCGACSPGQLIMEDVLREACARGLVELDFLGPDMPWKRDWADRVRPHHWCYVFRDTALGRGLHAAKFRVGPKVRKVLPGVMQGGLPWRR